MTSVPVTDAFDGSDAMESLEVELTPSQIEWVKRTAEERNVSVGHVLRTVVTAQMRSEEDGRSPMKSGDGAPPAFVDETTGAVSSDEEYDDALIDRLRSAKERLNNRSTGDDASDEPGREREDEERADEASALFPHIENVPSTAKVSAEEHDAADASSASTKDERSMFDMVEE